MKDPRLMRLSEKGIRMMNALKLKVKTLIMKRKPQTMIAITIDPQKNRELRVWFLSSSTEHLKIHSSSPFSRMILLQSKPTRRRPHTFFMIQKSTAEKMMMKSNL